MFLPGGQTLIAERTQVISRIKLRQIADILGIKNPDQFQTVVVTFVKKASAKKAKKASKKR